MASDAAAVSSPWTRFSSWLRRLFAALDSAPHPRPVLPAAPPVAAAGEDHEDRPGPAERIARRDPAIFADPRRHAVHDSFNSTQPIASRHDLYGRGDTLDVLFDAVIVRHQHALIYGARGSGKTSLVRVFADFADQHGFLLIYTACEPSQSFAALMTLYLNTIPDSALPSREAQVFRQRVRTIGPDAGARDVVELLADVRRHRLIFILDEYDRVRSPEVRAEVATLLKLLTDADIPVQMIMVGIARDLRDLVVDHPSVRRHLSAVPIGRIDARAVHEMIERGAERAGIVFDEGSRNLIVDLACGSPYHARLFCAHAALSALRAGDADVTAAATLAGIVAAARDWALMSDGEAGLFHTLADCSPDLQRALAMLARTAAVDDVVTAARLREQAGAWADEAIARFGPALMPQGDDRYGFRDSVAPQFFLAMLATRAAQQQPAPAPAPASDGDGSLRAEPIPSLS